MSIILTMIILATALATVVCSQPPAQKTIVIDGDLSDWSGILGYPENYVIDLIEAMGDLDYPTIQSADKDMIKWAYTWNSTHVFYYFKRNAGSNNVAQFLVYMDLDNDGYMNSTDKVARIEFDGQNKKCVDSLHDYAPTGGTPDMIMGDGYSMPGGVTNEVNDATFDPCSADGLQVEVSYKWEDLGATSGTPLRFHISSGRKGTNLPSAVEDNAGNISSRYAGVDIEASQNKGAKANTTITYIHNVTNFGNDIDTIDIEAIGTRAGWNVTIYDDSWNELTDSDLDGKADLIMNAGETKTIYVNFTIPADEDNGISDDTTIKATSSITPSLYDTVEDITTIGTLILLNQHDYLISSGASITYTHTVMNLNDPDVVEVAVKQTSDWNYALRYPNGTEIDDTDSDGIADFGNLSSGESKDFLLVVEVPSGADLSTSNTFTIYANFSSNLSIHANVQDKATIDERIQIQKNESGKAGVGSYIYYRHNVTNSYNESDILNLNWTGTLGWTATFYEEDKITELTDTNSDSMIDTGPIGPYGESKNIYVKLSVPSDATDGTSELTYIQATSSLDPDHSDLVMDNTTAYYMLVFNDSGRTNVDQYYKRNERVYAEAYGLQGTGKVFFQWIDPNATVQRTSPTINVDAGGQAQDDYLLNLTAIFGQWTLVIYSSPGSAEITRSYFHVNAPPNVTVTVPNGGEDWGGLQTIHWNASDINEDSLTFNVYQSPDGGSNFYLIQGGLSNSTRSLLWDTTTANDNMQSLIRVCAYDPYDSSCDASDAYFTVNNTMGDHEAPSVLSVWSNPYIINQTQYTNLTANITDESGINFTLVEVSFANGTVKNYTLSNNSNIWYYVFNTTEDHLPGNYTYRIYAYDRVGNVNDSEWGWFYVNDISNNSPPGTITNLHATSIGTSWIRWNWTNPSDADFNHTMIYVNWMWQANLYTPVHSVNITGLLNNTDYTIAILTVDHDGNVNTTWVINTARTGTIADYTPPSVVSVWSVPYLINQTQYTNLTANITDDHRINFTLVEVIFANGTVKNYTMSNNSNIWYYVFNTTPSYIPGNYTYKIYSQDMNGNMNDSEGSWFYVNSLYDPYPPGTVTNLNAPSIGTSWIYWTWTNPPDVDFNHTIIYLNWIWQANLNTPVNSVNFSGLINNTDYTISILTADHSGNINTTWVIDTVRTGTSPDHDAPVFNESETRPSGEYNQSDDVLFLVSIDESATVSATLDYPNGSQQKISLSHNGTDWYYAAIFSQTYALGQYNITYNATDGNGNWNVTHANFTVNDVTAPSVPDVNPDGANYDINDSVYISANVTDAYYDNMGIVVANVSWGPTYEMINLSYNATSGLWGGVFTNTTSIDIYTIRIIATDNASNVNDSETAVFTVGDMFPPLFSLVEPNDDVFNQSDSVHVIVCVSENSTVTANITWDSTHEQAILEYNGTEWCYEYIFTNTTWIGVYNISFNATDEYGNWNITFTNFTVQELADEIPPGSVLNLGSPSQTNTSIFWNWVNPIDLDFNSTMIYIDNVWEINLSVPVNYYNKTGLTPDTNHTITIYTIDHVGNVNTTGVNDTNKTLENPDIVPPSSVSNLMSPSQTNSSIYWNWSNPADADFNGTVIFINGSWVANLSAPVNYYNLTGLMPDAYYEITIHTVDHDGNINDTDVSNVNKTLANTIIDTDAPVFGVVEPSDDTYNKSDTVTFVVCVDENATIAANVSWDSTYES
ncbi:hypothetical protein JW968_06580, partial [Candidatus Woesearchaeota archaeon]|nr:hypothetical protein [Candidatus Woesearchaeota archaeon]